MSIKLMSAIFETEFPADFVYEKNGEKRTAKASTAKLVLLAIADHCNDEGVAYPGLSRLELKTALSRHAVIDTIEALKYNGIIETIGLNDRNKTNTYQINIHVFSLTSKELPINLYNAVVKPLHQGSEATSPEVVKPLHLNHQLTTNNHKATLTKKELQQADQQVRDMVEYSKKAKTKTETLLPEQWHEFGKAFTEATGIVYLPSQRAKWVGAFETWHNLGVLPEDVRIAAAQLEGYSVYSPMSLTNTLNGIVAQRKRPSNDPYKNMQWIDYTPEDLKG